MNFPQKQRKQSGFTLVEVAIASLVMVSVVTLGLYAYAQQMDTDIARAQGANLAALNGAVNAYEQTYAPQIVAGSPIAYPGGTGSVSALLAPTTADLQNLNLLTGNFAAFTPSGGQYRTRITVSPAGCSFNCAISGTVWLTAPILNRKGAVDYPALGDAMAAAGGDAAFSSQGSPSTVAGTNGQWSMSNPQGAVAGILAMRNGQGSGGISMNAYLRRDGSLPMVGNLNMGSQSITNATDVTAAGTVTGGTVNSTNANVGGTLTVATANVNWENVNTVFAGNVNSTNASVTNLNANALGTNTLNVGSSAFVNYLTLATGQTLNFGNANSGIWGDGWNVAIRAQGAFYVQNPGGGYIPVNAGTVNANGDVNVAGSVNLAGNVNASGYVAVGGFASAGGGCGPNGLIGRDGSGALLYCQNGLWATAGRPNIVTRQGPQDSNESIAACNANETMTGGMCYNTDSCGGNDSSAFGGFPSGNAMVCPRTSASFGCDHLTAYVFCAQ